MKQGVREQAMPDLLTLRELSERLRISRKTAGLMLKAGKIASFRVGDGRGTWRIKRSDLENFLSGRVRGGGSGREREADQAA